MAGLAVWGRLAPLDPARRETTAPSGFTSIGPPRRQWPVASADEVERWLASRPAEPAVVRAGMRYAEALAAGLP